MSGIAKIGERESYRERVNVREWNVVEDNLGPNPDLYGDRLRWGRYARDSGKPDDYWYWWLVCIDEKTLLIGFPGLGVFREIDDWTASLDEKLIAAVVELGDTSL